MTVSRIDQLLAADDANSKLAPKLISNLHDGAEGHFEATADMFRLLSKKTDERRDAQEATLVTIAQDMAVSSEDLASRLAAADPGVSELAHDAFRRLRALRLVKLLVLGTQRYWSWGATDFYRLRITPAVGYLRLEAESCALANLFLKDPELAIRWQSVSTKEEGKKLFRETQGSILDVLEKLKLKGAYEMASGGAQHVRMASLVRSMPDTGEIRLRDQEFDSDDPYSFHLALAYFHRIQSRVLFGFGEALTIRRHSDWEVAILGFEKQTNAIWDVLQERYAKEIAAGKE